MAMAQDDFLLRLGVHFHTRAESDDCYDQETKAEGDEEAKKWSEEKWFSNLRVILYKMNCPGPHHELCP